MKDMTKIFFKISSFSLVLMLLAGCNDFLDKDVKGYSLGTEYPETRYQAQTLLDATYDILQTDQMMNSDWVFGDATSDDGNDADESFSSDFGQLVQFRFNTSNPYISARYEIYYKGIHRANQVIANINKVQLTTTDYTSYKDVREILGQAKFLRAYFYFNLLRTFGGVPIRPETESVDSLVVPRSTKEEVFAYIEKDLREAAIMLPSKYDEKNSGKVGEGAAVALLMKVLMYEATPGIQSDKWQEIVKLGKFFVDGAPMTFGDILKYDSSKEDWETLRERLWFKPKSENVSTDPYEVPSSALTPLVNAYKLDYKDYYDKTITYYDQWFQAGEFCKGSIWEIVFKESADGTSGDANEGESIYQNIFYNQLQYAYQSDINAIFSGDPREKIMIDKFEYAPDNVIISIPLSGRFVCLKWYTPEKELPQYSGDNGKNRRVLRYADVVLMYAEALNECGNGAEALAQINKTKAVANTINGSAKLYVGGGYGFMRDQIWKERRIEFCFEWDRFFDIVRQGRAASLLQAYGMKKVTRRGYYFREGVNEIFPIPQREVDLSNGVVKQNPGY
jgi:hypothetical protein